MQIIVTPQESGLRLDKFLASRLNDPDLSREKINKWIRQGRARINGQVCSKPNQRVNSGEKVEIDFEKNAKACEGVAGRLDIEYLDSDLIVLNKPSGLNVHPAPSEKDNTLVHYLLYHFPEMRDLDTKRPGIVHRLDKKTSGLIVVGRTARAVDSLSRDISQRKVYKEYLAIVHGIPLENSAAIDAPIGRDPVSKTRMKVLPEQGKQAWSKYRLIWVFPGREFSLLQVRILTGRTHQIRVHLSYIGCPVLGDGLYNKNAVESVQKKHPGLSKLVPRQMLLDFIQEVPRDFQRVLLQLQRSRLNVGISGQFSRSKSYLLQALQQRKIAVHSDDADLCREFEPGADGWEMFRRTFGEKYFIQGERSLDKERILARMQSSEQFKKEVLELLQPLLEHRIKQIVQKKARSSIFVVEIPDYCWTLSDPGKYFHIQVFVYSSDRVAKKNLCPLSKNNKCTGPVPEGLCLDKKQLAKQADLIVCDCSDKLQLQKKARAIKNILLDLKRKKIKSFYNELKEMGVI